MKQPDDKIYYKIEGVATKGTVVLLHGFLGNSEIWNTMMPYLSGDFQIVRIDLPGHGQTSLMCETIGMDLIANEIIDILKKERINTAHFVGHSMGGYVGLEVLSKLPKIVQSLTLFNSTAMDDSIQKRKDRLLAVKVFNRSPEVFINAAIENLFYEPNLKRFPEEVKGLQRIALGTPVKGAQGSLRGMSERSNHVELIRNSTIPILIIAGRFDNTVKYESILEQVENSKIILVTLESGHMGFVESFEESKEALVNFINN